MSLADLTKDAEQKMKKTVDATQHDFSTIRTGRATPTLVDGISVDYFGTPTPLTQLAGISVPDSRQLLITPYDRSMTAAIEKAIKNSDLNINPVNDGVAVRLTIPPLTEERRKEFVKILNKKSEEGRVSIRNIRRDINDQFKALVKKSEASEDESKRAQDGLQKLTDRYIIEIDRITKAKEAELLEV
ncbi:MAG: ribosome recycling factor [Janthinobacterium lividum]